MSRILAALLAGLLLATWSPPAAAGKKKKVTESYDVQGLPYPVTGASNGGLGCAEGVEGIHKNTFEFTTPGRGILDVTLSEFMLDWDLHVLAADGTILGQSIGGPDVTSERVVIPLAPKTDIGVVACNWSGTPTAHVDFKFTY